MEQQTFNLNSSLAFEQIGLLLPNQLRFQVERDTIKDLRELGSNVVKQSLQIANTCIDSKGNQVQYWLLSTDKDLRTGILKDQNTVVLVFQQGFNVDMGCIEIRFWSVSCVGNKLQYHSVFNPIGDFNPSSDFTLGEINIDNDSNDDELVYFPDLTFDDRGELNDDVEISLVTLLEGQELTESGEKGFSVSMVKPSINQRMKYMFQLNVVGSES